MSAATATRTYQDHMDVGGYKYTHPRTDIGAMFNSPGPGCYLLPDLVGEKHHDPRSVHNKNPGWSFGIRHGKFKDDCSPGPAYLPNAKIYRDGKDGTPHYSLYSRNEDLQNFKTPGPGAYRPESTGPTGHPRYPAYSFGIRHKQRRTDQTPAPNRYSLPGMIGHTVQSGKRQAPCISVRGRSNIGSFSEDMSKTPGPAKYNVVDPGLYKNASPSYSMTSRNMLPGDATRKPGPGAHSPERVTMNKRKAPVITFGLRHSEYTVVPIQEISD
ncbi:outer dense fiber protein 3-like [Pomacea canaliculata]|uniref:outer dense fiber protein 3-like n=1 Tax=Pomacea canaliculata TaxID=400727 RepID=UPI000D72A48B|nr:outer dense fiber protein 3-like [Pomacea canaliculata]XP_025098560.1 outer dense fiber protein 3-like [Pomacea canaliculata]